MGVDDQKRGWVSQVHRLELEEIGFGLLEEKDKKNGDPGAAHDEMSTLCPRSFPISVLANEATHWIFNMHVCFGLAMATECDWPKSHLRSIGFLVN